MVVYCHFKAESKAFSSSSFLAFNLFAKAVSASFNCCIYSTIVRIRVVSVLPHQPSNMRRIWRRIASLIFIMLHTRLPNSPKEEPIIHPYFSVMINLSCILPSPAISLHSPLVAYPFELKSSITSAKTFPACLPSSSFTFLICVTHLHDVICSTSFWLQVCHRSSQLPQVEPYLLLAVWDNADKNPQYFSLEVCYYPQEKSIALCQKTD